MAGKFKLKIKMQLRSLKKIKVELKRLGALPVLQNPGIQDQAMPIPVISGGETDKPFPPMKKCTHDDIRKMVSFGKKIRVGRFTLVKVKKVVLENEKS